MPILDRRWKQERKIRFSFLLKLGKGPYIENTRGGLAQRKSHTIKMIKFQMMTRFLDEFLPACQSSYIIESIRLFGFGVSGTPHLYAATPSTPLLPGRPAYSKNSWSPCAPYVLNNQIGFRQVDKMWWFTTQLVCCSIWSMWISLTFHTGSLLSVAESPMTTSRLLVEETGFNDKLSEGSPTWKFRFVRFKGNRNWGMEMGFSLTIPRIM